MAPASDKEMKVRLEASTRDALGRSRMLSKDWAVMLTDAFASDTLWEALALDPIR